MPHKKIRFKLDDENVIVCVSGEAAKNALGALYERLIKTRENHEAGLAAIEMFLMLFGEEITEKLLCYCMQKPEKAMKKFGRVIKRKIYPLAVRQRKHEDRQGVKKYL
ncbi:MAG: hypothetical protein LBC86_04345 [Oscillospiraceae bacterium]|jgi:hypothetical protein|nr:hypothetical protein [Oscillospiraceae bacterium]